MKKTRVLLAEDSPTTRELLTTVLKADREIELVGTAADGRRAVELTKELRPDVVVMDISMPVMDGFEATTEIMTEVPTPVVIVSANLDVYEASVSGHALRAGAVAVLPKPEGAGTWEADLACRQFVATVKAMGSIKVARRLPRPVRSGVQTATRVVGMYASMGGPAALHHVVSGLPAHFAAPVLVVLRVAPGFVKELAEALDMASVLRVKLAQHGEPLVPQTVYLAPDDQHLGVGEGPCVVLTDDPPIDGCRPSATFLFQSLARQFGAAATAVVLTGKGTDGIEGLRALRQAGGRVIAQDKKTSVSFETAAAATQAGLVDMEVPMVAIPATLVSLVAGRSSA